MILSIFKKDFLIFGYISAGLFFFLALASFKIELNYCDFPYTNSTMECATKNIMEDSISYLYVGLGLIMLVYSIVMTFWGWGEQLSPDQKQQED
jgi:hypothetical protein